MRHLPWLQEAAARNPDAVAHLLDCGKCKRTRDRETRQTIMSCGYETPIDGAPRWRHPGSHRVAAPSACVGYLCSLPDVIQISRRRMHWERGGAAAVKDERERYLIEEMAIQSNAAEAYSIRESTKR